VGRLEIPNAGKVKSGTIQLWDGNIADIPDHWLLCDAVFVEANLISRHSLDNVLTDSVGTNDGTVTGTTTFDTTPRIVGTHSFDFDGASRITFDGDVETNYDFENNNDFTISFWFRGSGTGVEFLAGKRNGVAATDQGYSVHITSGGDIQFETCNGATIQAVTSDIGDLRDGEWHLVVATFNGNANRSGLFLYIDGIFIIQGADAAMTGSNLNNDEFTIGGDDVGGNDFTGNIDDVRVYSNDVCLHDVRKIYINPPDLTASFVRGIPNATTEPSSTGGEDTTVLVTADLPSHSHSYSEGTHSPGGLATNTGITNNGNGSVDDSFNLSNSAGGTATSSDATGVTLGNLGSDTAHENRPSFFQEAYIIKV